MKRRSRTIAQQCRYYEVDNIFEYMVSVYLNGNISDFGESEELQINILMIILKKKS